MRSVPIDNLSLPNGQKFKDFINKNFDGVDIFLDEHVAIYGGIARLALKLHASGTHGGEDGGLVESEIPINDIDIISDDSVTAGNYKSGIAGTRVVQDIEEYIKTYYDSVECTKNQTLIYRGKLFFTPDALKDCTVGDLNFIEKDETLFNPDSVVLRDGKIFITSKGLYRALIYLLRQKAYRLTIYKQNLDCFIGDKSLWATLLPKILSIKDRGSKDRAIRLWFNLASNLEATETEDPFDFLQEIIRKNPSIVNYNFKTEENNAEEIRWIINQFLRSGIRNTAPEQYPEGMADNTITIDIRNPVLLGGEYDLNKFYDLINATFKNTNRWIREYIPKRSDLTLISDTQIKDALYYLNDMPRQILGYKKASMLYYEHVLIGG